MSKPCPRCAAHREAIAQLGYGAYCSNCFGRGVVRDDGSAFIDNPILADLTTEELEQHASRLFQYLDQVNAELERRYDEVPVEKTG